VGYAADLVTHRWTRRVEGRAVSEPASARARRTTAQHAVRSLTISNTGRPGSVSHDTRGCHPVLRGLAQSALRPSDGHHAEVVGRVVARHTGVVSAVRCDIDHIGTRLLVTVIGDLSLSTAPRLRMTLLKCLLEQPDAVVADLTALTVSESQALSVFSAVSRQAARWPGTPLLLCASQPEVAGLLASGRYGRLETFDSTAQALAAARARMVAVSEVLLPVPGAARRARDLVTEACVRWELPRLIGPACLVVSELVVNATVHARTMMDLRITRDRHYLIIAVRDGSTAVPRLARTRPADAVGGRGLMLVDSMVRRWGSLVVDDGKVVWATLPIDPAATRAARP
jgi:anti-anti-sigma factor